MKVSPGVLLGLMLILALWVTAGPGPGAAPQISPASFGVAVNGFGAQFPLGKPVPLMVCLGYMGHDVLYVEWHHGIRITDVNGHEIPSGPVDTPPPPPGDWYIHIAGKQTLVVPVSRMDPGTGLVKVVANGLERYNLPPGTYTVVASVVVAQYEPEEVIIREDMPHKTWVPARGGVTQFTLTSNAVTIQIVDR